MFKYHGDELDDGNNKRGWMEMMSVLIVLMLFIGIGHVYAQTGPVLDIRMDEGMTTRKPT